MSFFHCSTWIRSCRRPFHPANNLQEACLYVYVYLWKRTANENSDIWSPALEMIGGKLASRCARSGSETSEVSRLPARLSSSAPKQFQHFTHEQRGFPVFDGWTESPLVESSSDTLTHTGIKADPPNSKLTFRLAFLWKACQRQRPRHRR